MNIIKTVGDLRKALSAYPQDMRVTILVGRQEVTLNNDTQIFQLNGDEVVISLSLEVVPA